MRRPNPPGRILSAIDIGTNSVKLTVLAFTPGPESLLEEIALVRPGEGVQRTGRMLPQAIDRTVRAVARFRRAAERRGAEPPDVVATEWLRRVRNRNRFLARVPCRVLSAKEEARLAYLAAARMLRTDGPMVDLGGGSAEILLGRGGRLAQSHSLPLGAVFLTEKHLKHDPPLPAELDRMDREILRHLRKVRPERSSRLVAIGGSAAALAFLRSGAPRFDPERFHGACLSRTELERLERELASCTTLQRRRRFRLEAGRADVIVAGARVLRRVMEWAGAGVLRVCTFGVRHGVLLDRVARGG